MCINSISGQIENTNKRIDAVVGGRSIVITGPNGCGKTSLLRQIHNKIVRQISNNEYAQYKALKEELINLEKQNRNNNSQNEYVQQRLLQIETTISQIESGIQVEFLDAELLRQLYTSQGAIIRYFEASRQTSIEGTSKINGLERFMESHRNSNDNTNCGSKLEQFLVNLKNRASLALTEDRDEEMHQRLNAWIVAFEKNLQFLFEDTSTKLKFDSNNLVYKIKQSSKPEFSFQTLSSGYMAIFDIYADLVMRSEFWKISPENLTGVVLIDEIDVHLHVSLQKKIFSFLTKSFPKIQFIITTHSPFVLMTAKNSYIYDLGKDELISESLTNYSYSSIIEGLLNVSTVSDETNEDLRMLSELISTVNVDANKITEILEKLEANYDNLDPEGQAFFLLAKRKVSGTNV